MNKSMGNRKKINKNKSSFLEGSTKWTKLSPIGEEKEKDPNF